MKFYFKDRSSNDVPSPVTSEQKRIIWMHQTLRLRISRNLFICTKLFSRWTRVPARVHMNAMKQIIIIIIISYCYCSWKIFPAFLLHVPRGGLIFMGEGECDSEGLNSKDVFIKKIVSRNLKLLGNLLATDVLVTLSQISTQFRLQPCPKVVNMCDEHNFPVAVADYDSR